MFVYCIYHVWYLAWKTNNVLICFLFIFFLSSPHLLSLIFSSPLLSSHLLPSPPLLPGWEDCLKWPLTWDTKGWDTRGFSRSSTYGHSKFSIANPECKSLIRLTSEPNEGAIFTSRRTPRQLKGRNSKGQDINFDCVVPVLFDMFLCFLLIDVYGLDQPNQSTITTDRNQGP